MEQKPLAVPPKVGFGMLGVGTTLGYELLNTGELESFTMGRARRITVRSIEDLIARRVEAQRAAA